jgi:hypothetical protein
MNQSHPNILTIKLCSVRGWSWNPSGSSGTRHMIFYWHRFFLYLRTRESIKSRGRASMPVQYEQASAAG